MLVGLVLFMHALSVTTDNGDSMRSGGHDGAAHASGPVSGPVSSGPVSSGREVLAADPVAEGPVAPAPGHAGTHGAVALMCLAVLALTALLVLRPGSGRGWWPSLPGVSRCVRVVALVRSRGPAPPDLHQLSILRC